MTKKYKFKSLREWVAVSRAIKAIHLLYNDDQLWLKLTPSYRTPDRLPPGFYEPVNIPELSGLMSGWKDE